MYVVALAVARGPSQAHATETYTAKANLTTFNNGSLGSRNDEERSEMRNVMRFAAPVSHRVFERTGHRRLRRYTCLSIATHYRAGR